MTPDEVVHIFVEIASGRGKHGDFLKSFAEAVIRADEDNLKILRLASLNLILKYNLDKYLDNYQK